MNKNFFFTFYPTQERYPRNGRATHYPRNQGIVRLDEDLMEYIYRCRVYGKTPELYAQGWYNKRDNTFNAGFAVPRNDRVQECLDQEQSTTRSTLAAFFDSEESQ